VADTVIPKWFVWEDCIEEHSASDLRVLRHLSCDFLDVTFSNVSTRPPQGHLHLGARHAPERAPLDLGDGLCAYIVPSTSRRSRGW
jgi:hypothetical protein